MSVVVTQVQEDAIIMAADIGFSDDSTKWTDRNALKIISHRDIFAKDVLVGVTGSASHLTVMKAFLRSIYEPIHGDEAGIFKLVSEFVSFSSTLGLPTGVEIDGAFSTFHIVAEGRAWATQGLFISEITEWDVMGSGDPFARATMTLGLSPEESVAMACKHDLYCYGPPVSYTFDRHSNRIIDCAFHDELDCSVV